MIKSLFFLWEFLKGIYITARHFWINIFFNFFKLIGFKIREKGSVTIQYPEEKKELAYRHRSLHRILSREDGSPRCVACLLCMTVCPSECIYVEAEEDPNPEIQKRPALFIIDISRCCFCGFCVEACPEDALRMDTNIVELAEYKREKLIYELDKLVKISNGKIQMSNLN
jgi:NADH-quinone oxidoreductase subunit I